MILRREMELVVFVSNRTEDTVVDIAEECVPRSFFFYARQIRQEVVTVDVDFESLLSRRMAIE
jgi:hypothetical protein